MTARAAVVDASVLLTAVLPDPQAPAAQALLRELISSGTRLHSAPIVLGEVAATLHRQVVIRNLLPEEAAAAIDAIAALRLDTTCPDRVYANAIDLAVRLNRTSLQDCLYAALASHLDCEYWTASRRFFLAVQVRLPSLRFLGDYAATRA